MFDGVPPPSAPTPATRIEQFDVDDSEQGLLSGRRSGREFRPVVSRSVFLCMPRLSETVPLQESSSFLTIIIRPIRVVFNILAIPLYPLFSLLRFIFRALHIPLPNFGSFTFSYRPLGPGPSREAKDPKSVAERWVRALEEETGAVCISRSASRRREQSNGHSVATGVAGPSNLTARGGAWEEGSTGVGEGELKLLPDFFLGGYEEFARTCQRDIKVGCVIIVSEEHDDDAEFKRLVSLIFSR